PSLRRAKPAGPETRFTTLRSDSRPGLPRLDTPTFGGSEGKKDSSAVRPSPEPSPAGRGSHSYSSQLDATENITSLVCSYQMPPTVASNGLLFHPFWLAERRANHAEVSGLAV